MPVKVNVPLTLPALAPVMFQVLAVFGPISVSEAELPVTDWILAKPVVAVAMSEARLTVTAAPCTTSSRACWTAPPSTLPASDPPAANLNVSVDVPPVEVGDAREGDAVDVARVGAGDGPGVGDVGALEYVAGTAAGDGRRGALAGGHDERVVAAGAAAQGVGAAVADDDVAGRGAGDVVVGRSCR